MYVELDHRLVPGYLQDINEVKVLEGQSRKSDGTRENHYLSTLNVQKYFLRKGPINKFLAEIEANPRPRRSLHSSYDSLTYDGSRTPSPIGTPKESNMVFAAGTETKDVWFDYDLGFFSSILACYNNHWVLKTSPDDWWNVIAKTVASSIDDNGEVNKVRDFFVDHFGEKRDIIIDLPGRLDQVNYDWLFDQFAKGIKDRIKAPGYVDKMVCKFSTTDSCQLISNQVMLMSSMNKYFKFRERTLCGIPGVNMQGTHEDWQKLEKNTRDLQKLLQSILDDIELKEWFDSTLDILKKLVDTYEGKPDKDWWGHILSWNEVHSSGDRDYWSGWIVDFLKANPKSQSPKHFQGGVVSVPLEIKDENFGPPVEDVGTLVAGTVGFKVDKGVNEKYLEVEAQQGWALLLPQGSPIIARLKGKDVL